MKKIEQLEVYIEKHRATAAEYAIRAETYEEEQFAEGYLAAVEDVADGIEGVWGWTRLKN